MMSVVVRRVNFFPMEFGDFWDLFESCRERGRSPKSLALSRGKWRIAVAGGHGMELDVDI